MKLRLGVSTGDVVETVMQTLVDEPLTLSPEEQTAFNTARWAELVADPQWQRWEGRIETDEYGNVIMMPPPQVIHATAESEIVVLLRQLLGRAVLTECPISTIEGVKSADVAWMSSEAHAKVKNAPCLPAAPPICVEVLSPSNSRREMIHKKALYFKAGAVEVWFCDRKGKMTFHLSPDDAGSATSRFCPKFPAQVEL
ncbi:MAG TPA: Uma2 family endonuclease [Chthoniobacteraceae bacterium]|jgi:Uma2 family endonuclease|nr:Uma2 family endonuclease [Chthoniobacteraceae bacterium]